MDRRKDGWKDGQTDGRYFIGPFRPRPGVQLANYLTLSCIELMNIVAKYGNLNINLYDKFKFSRES